MPKLNLLIEARPFCAFDKSPMELLKNAGLALIDMRGSGIQDAKFMDILKNVEIVLAGNDLMITSALLDSAPALKAVAKLGVGLDTVDIEAASRHHISVFNTPGANTQAVADHTFALILGLARRIISCDQSLRENRWEHTKIMGLEIWQKTIGLIGLGAIGRSVALRAKGFEMKVVAYDPYWPETFAAEHRIQKMEVADLLKISDIVSIHSPLTPQNRNLINKTSFDIMKPTAVLINTARGEIVNEKDLYQALKNNWIAGAGIDVFENEPPVNSPLLELDNILLTPHTAAFTREAMDNMSDQIAAQIVEFTQGNPPQHLVNPEVFV